jgi:glycosyltransferase involved in cell wall biosynthesis
MAHTFVIPVYRAAPNLAALIESLRAQTEGPSEILLATSTPTPELHALAERYALPVYINPQRVDIAADWNFALAAAKTANVTLAHQDDLYAADYVAKLVAALRRHPGALLAFSDYSEHTALGPRPTNINLRIKRALRYRAFGARECLTEPRDKLRLLSFGNPICCPSVMLNRAALVDFSFPSGLQSNLDWMAWLELARCPGGFMYVDERLVSKGVHPASETTAAIANRAREREDRALFAALWPRPVAAALATLYRLAQLANRV